MKRRWSVTGRVVNRIGLVLACVIGASGCGADQKLSMPASTGSGASAPILQASLSSTGYPFDLPGCQALRAAYAGVGLSTTTCPQFTGIAKNTGAGCAGHIHGTTQTSHPNGQSTGFANWTYASTVRPGEQFAYSGGPITVSSGTVDFHYVTTFAWDNVRC